MTAPAWLRTQYRLCPADSPSPGQETGEDSVFGYGFLPGILALVIWSIATSIVSYRAVASSGREGGARKAEA
jgi:hypothetical protein